MKSIFNEDGKSLESLDLVSEFFLVRCKSHSM